MESDESKTGVIRGRGTAIRPGNRFAAYHAERDEDLADVPDDPGRPPTEFLKDNAKSIVATNTSPDIGFDASVNPYRGCEHGCVYCYARPTHEYLGFSAGLDFETKILVKEDAPELLLRELASPKWKPRTLAMSGVTDPFQPIERRLQLTRRCLEVLARCINPVFLITKNHLVTRDIDHLAELAAHRATSVLLSITTLDADLCGILEPRTSRPTRRLDAIRALAAAGIPVGVNVAPVIPGLTDHELPAILEAAREAGATFAGYTLVRLPLAVAPIFEQWLDRHYPDRKEKVLNRIRDIRGGRLNDPDFGSRMRGSGVYAAQVRTMFRVTTRRLGFEREGPALSAASFVRPEPPPRKRDESQLDLF